jgi:hypothetical protein
LVAGVGRHSTALIKTAQRLKEPKATSQAKPSSYSPTKEQRRPQSILGD